MKRLRLVRPFLPMLLLAACGPALVPQVPQVRQAGMEAGVAASASRPAAPSSSVRYSVDPRASLVAVTVRRAGLMARLGHDHVVASHTLAGDVLPGAGTAEMSFRLDQMTVDEPQLLREAGIDKQPSVQAIAGTRTNMLGPVLDAQRYPVVTLRAQQQANGTLDVAITLHGTTRTLALPATIEVDAAQASARGTVRLKQSDFGITPFSVGAGLLAVQDELDVRYQIVARR